MKATDFANCYADSARVEAYAKLQFARTYYLAYRDLPEIFRAHVGGNRAVDFGCGAGRSTRFLREHGFNAVGIDISPEMIAKAREVDPAGDYRLIRDGDFSQLPQAAHDLVLAAFTFDNIEGEKKVALFRGLAGLLNDAGKIVMIVSDPQIYMHEWASFSSKDFLRENLQARSGDRVKIIVLDHGDLRPVEDIFWTAESYCEVFEQAGFAIAATYKPLARGDEPYEWVNETRLAPWVIYVLKKR